MNDFTKKELKDILGALMCHGCQGDELYEKVKSMIDSYCEHKYVAVAEISLYSCKCTKCGRTRERPL